MNKKTEAELNKEIRKLKRENLKLKKDLETIGLLYRKVSGAYDREVLNSQYWKKSYYNSHLSDNY